MKSKGVGFYITVGSAWGGFRIQADRLGLRIVLGWFGIAFTNYDIDFVIGAMAERIWGRKE